MHADYILILLRDRLPSKYMHAIPRCIHHNSVGTEPETDYELVMA